MSLPYNDYTTRLREILGVRVQKISINAGFTCPNRDGKVGKGGCTYCNNQTFNPEYCMQDKSVTQQITEGISFFRKKHEEQKFLAYFQAYTNTYGELRHLISLYEEALTYPDVIGLVIGTRPDCVNEELLDYFQKLSRKCYVMIEYGVESTNDKTLNFINRGHTFENAQNAIRATAERGIYTAAHLILGLPGEDRPTLLSHALHLSKLPLTAIKLHQLQLIKGTAMAQQYIKHPEWFRLFSVDEYIDLCIDFLELLHPDISIERFTSLSPYHLLLAPDWKVKNYEFVVKLQRRMKERNTQQGKLYHSLI
ncbi:TIGR01212 family radical SAM protein [Paludibacter sp.]|uniref:TIGR01212 family radical SAM protein n=1 Tax=Paludibacter sp. TaxID=1898105 RepID=UPI001355267F|nr:TIGR01212 family radical SAM protein [Paludibacter sp.]MTK54249.1 TIGR01212 family radical SAM protein [Paludibacter sp.]